MELIKCNGRISEDSDFVSFEITGGKNENSIGDQVWFSKCGKEMEIYLSSDIDVLIEVSNMFNPKSKYALRGYLRRMGRALD